MQCKGNTEMSPEASHSSPRAGAAPTRWAAGRRAVLTWVFTGMGVAGVVLSSAPAAGPLWVAVWRQEVEAALTDPWISGMGLVCLLAYSAGVAWLRCRGGAPPREKLRLGALLAAMAAVVIASLWRHPPAFGQPAVIFCFGVFVGQGMGLWQQWATAGGPKNGAARSGPVLPLTFWTVAVLAASVVFRGAQGHEYFYREVSRWTGIWNHPNEFGVMMSLGVLLALGGVFNGWCPAAETRSRRWGLRLLAVVCGLCLPVLAFGLFRSYSRGAWLGTVVALVWLFYRWRRAASPESAAGAAGTERQQTALGRRLRPFAVPVLVLSLLILAFWAWRSTEVAPVRRAFSAANPNDFSWRNRTAAWVGALQIMADHPWAGVGWNRADSIYDAHYRPVRVPEGGALRTNDVLMIGVSTGVPVLVCVGLYFWLSFARSGRRDTRLSALPGWCGAAALALAVGAWFDGALLAWPGGVFTWVLLEMAVGGGASRPARAIATVAGLALPENAQAAKRNQRLDRVVVALALAAALAALAVTTAHLGLPLLRGTPRALSWAEQILIGPAEEADFAFLSREVDWSGERVRALLEHLRLARYNRELVPWKLSEPLFREFVLSPKINGTPAAGLNWRRTLWEHCRPRVRQEGSPAAAAAVVVSFLRSRVTVSDQAAARVSPGEAFERQQVSPGDFEILTIAALRATGIPARLGPDSKAELWSGEQWTPAPRPLAERLASEEEAAP